MSIRRERLQDLALFILLCAVVLLVVAEVPRAMEKQVEHNQALAESRCMKDGEFDNSTDYCKAVEKAKGV